MPDITGPQRNPHKTHAQKSVSTLWTRLHPKYPSKPYIILPEIPDDAPEHIKAARVTDQTRVYAEYADAAAACKLEIESIGKECRRVNKKFHDRAFDLQLDQWRKLEKDGTRDTLLQINQVETENCLDPKAVKRVEVIVL